MPPPLNSHFVTLVDAWCAWLEHNRGRRPGTVEKYAGHLMKLGTWCAQPPEDARQAPSTSNPMKLTRADLDTFAGLWAHAQGLSPRARRPLVSAVRGFFAWCESNGHIEKSPAADLPQPKAGLRLPRAIDLRQAERLLMAPGIDTLAGYRDTAILAMFAGVGCRLSGLVAMNESALIWTSDDDGPHLTVRLCEKGKKERLVPAPMEVAMMLRAYLDHPDLQGIDRTLPDGDRVLFVNLKAPAIPAHEYHGERRRLTPRGVGRRIEIHAKRVGVPKEMAHPHALRHLYGAELAEEDVDLLQRQALLGHVDPKTTEIYTQLAQRKLRATVAKANPVAKMRGPLLDTLRSLHAAVRPPSRPAKA